MRKLITAILALMLFALVGCEKQEISAPKVGLHTAVVTDDLDAIRQHIKVGSNLNVLESKRKSTPLITAAAIGRTEAAEILIYGGADINYKNVDGSTALHTAIAFGKTEVAKILIDSGIELNIKNNDGSTALHTAAFFCNLEIVEALLENGADKTLRNTNLATPLEIVEPPFEDVKGVYDAIGARLYPLGITLDYEHIKMTRPKIAEMLREI
jgi:ankyrin repeat protein